MNTQSSKKSMDITDILVRKRTRKPGRPRKTPRHHPIPIEGVVKKPKCPNHIVELYYHNPNNLKKILQFLHQESVTDIFISFKRDKMILLAEDAVNKSKIQLIIDGTRVNRYFTSTIVNIDLNFDDLKIFGDKLDGSYDALTFIVDKERERSSLDFLLENSFKIDEMTHVIVNKMKFTDQNDISYKEKKFADHISEEEYPLKFELPGKYLKKMIIDAKNAGGGRGQLRVEKHGDDPLEFTYASGNNRVQESRKVRDEKIIKVTSRLTKEESLSTAVCIDYIKPLNSFLASADKVTIYCSKIKPMIFDISIENGVFSLIVVVDVVNLRQMHRCK